MSKPNISEKVGGYDLEWQDHAINISVTRIKQHKDGRINGWVMVTSTAQDVGGLIHQADFNFISGQMQSSLAKLLTSKNSKLPWDSIIEALRYHILERVRQGEPPLEIFIDPDEEIVPLRYLINPILIEDEPTIIFGPPAVGKTELALTCYISLLLPWYDNPFGWTVPEKSTRALILDWENSEYTIKRRMKSLQNGMGLGAFPLYYRRCFLPLAEDMDQICQAIDKVKADVLIIDSLGLAAGGSDLKEAGPATTFFQALRQINKTPLVIAQTSKDPEKNISTIFGSTMFSYYSRSIWEAKKSQEVGSDILNVALHHRKSNESKLHHSQGFRVSFNETKTSIERTDIITVPEFRETMSAANRIQYLLKNGPQTAMEAAEILGITETSATSAMSRLKEKGIVISLKDKKWGLLTKNG